MECAWCRHTVYNLFSLKYIFVSLSLSLSKCKEATTNCIMRFFSDVYIRFINMLWFSLHGARCLLSTIVWVRARVCIFFNESEKKTHTTDERRKKKCHDSSPQTKIPSQADICFLNLWLHSIIFFLSLTLCRSLSLFLFWISLFFGLNCSFPSKFEWKKHLFRLKKYYRKV